MDLCHPQSGIFSLFFGCFCLCWMFISRDGVPYCIRVNLIHSSAEFRSGDRSSVLNI